MKMLRHPVLLITVSSLLAGLVLLFSYYRQAPADEITPKQLNFLIQKKLIAKASVTPLAYEGIYSIDGIYGADAKGEGSTFDITAHLDRPQLDRLLAQPQVKIHVPGRGTKAQWLNLIPTVIIGGLIIFLVV